MVEKEDSIRARHAIQSPEKNEIVLRTMKSEWGSDEIFGVPPQMKLNPPLPNLAKQDFIICAYRLRYIASFGVSARRIANFIHEVDLFRRRRI